MSRMLNKPGAERVYLGMNAAFSLFSATIFVTYTVYFVNRVHLDPLQLVLVGTTLEATALVFEVPTGLVADLYGRRLSVILGMLLVGAAFAWIGLAPSFAVVLIGQVISGIGYTFLSGATDAWLADEAGEDQIARIYLRSGQINRAMGLLGTGLSVALASQALNLPYLCGGLGFLVLALFLVWAMEERHFTRPAAGQRQLVWTTVRQTLGQSALAIRRSPVLRMLTLVSLVGGAASEGFDRLHDAHLLQNFTFPALGALQPVVWFGILSACGGVFSMLVVALLQKRAARASQNATTTARFLFVLNGLSIAAVIVFALTGSFLLAAAALFVKAAADALSTPLYTTWLVQNIQPQVRATVLSMSAQANAIGQVTFGPGIGAVGRGVSLRAALVLAGALLAPVSLLYGRSLRAGESRAAGESPVVEPLNPQSPG
ncbi:MAG TPA: MFS transporter [Anaerolineaceae bacterium]|nr:MFS transporter [Anaerolineaceae bacterium]